VPLIEFIAVKSGKIELCAKPTSLKLKATTSVDVLVGPNVAVCIPSVLEI
jgi:hypothetical protein